MLQKLSRFILLAVLFSGCNEYKTCEQIREENLAGDLEFIADNTQLPNRPLTLTDIIEVANQRNLDLLAKRQEWAIQHEIASRETLKMLPDLIVSGEKSHRNKPLATSGEQFPSGIPVPPSVTVSKFTSRWDVTLTYRILDFALAFFHSRAEDDRAVSVYFQYVRLRQNLMLDIYRSYWKAIVAKTGADRAQEILSMAQTLQGRVSQQIKNRFISEIQGLRIEDQLLSIQFRSYSFYDEYQAAKAELASFMGIPAGTQFELASANVEQVPNPDDIEELEEIALHSRPELYGLDFNELASTEDVRAAIIQLLPGISFFRGYHEDRDRFLIFHHWFIGGATAAWNLLSLPWHHADISVAKRQRLFARDSRLALSVAVLAQLHIARWKFDEMLGQYKIQHDIEIVRNQLLNATQKEHVAGEFTALDVMYAASDALQATVGAMQAYGELQVSMEQLNNAIGRPLYYNTLPDESDYELIEEGMEECLD